MSGFNLPKIEEEILEMWKKDRVFQKSLKDKPKGDFVFYEGPPTANGRPGIHHVLSRAYKDIILRFRTMQGYRVIRKAGWDTHGLPVELEVEKKLGLKNKKEIEEYGIDKFNEKCKESVWEYKKEWERLTERIAFWLDLEDPYITYNRDYIETLWWIIKQWAEKGLLYEGHKVVPHCPRCGTALSSHEVAQGYKKVEDNSIYVKFKVEGKDNVYILAWTTTPWTLPGNVALAVGGDIDYVKAKVKTEAGYEVYILAKDLAAKVLDNIEYNIVETVKGSELAGLRYEPLYDVLKDEEGEKYVVLEADFVSIEDGTGIVHTAVMYGDDDYRLGMEKGLVKAHTVNEDGTFKDLKGAEQELFDRIKGKFVKDVEEDIIENLKVRNLLFKDEKYEHDYPFCWRCSTPLLYYAKHSWFVKVTEVQDKLLENNEQINWYPKHIKYGRFGEWLKDIKDWAFSRERYWGTPLPVWKCSSAECGNVYVAGSIKEVEEKSGQKIEDPHRPYIDEVVFDCEKCGADMKRVKDVVDVWFDSGAMPYAQYHYPFENKELIDYEGGALRQFPADYICEAIDQTRGWFYTLLAVSTLLGRQAPYKNVICLGHILDKNGQKMSKSKGNVVNPWEMIEKYGSDAVRWYFYTLSSPGDPKKFDEEGLRESSRIFITLLNVVNFYLMFADEVEVGDLTSYDEVENVLDKWVLSKVSHLAEDTCKRLENYDITGAARRIGDFIMDLSTWYVRRSRDRFKSEDDSVKTPALKTLKYVLVNLAKIIAPFTPFTADYIYTQKLGQKSSVHLSDYPVGLRFDKDVIEKTDTVRRIVEAGLAARMDVKIAVRQPLNKAVVYGVKVELSEEYLDVAADELNVKSIEIKPEGEFKVELDTEITPDLKKEGIKREFVRGVNSLRKKMNLTIKDKINIVVDADETLKEVIADFKDQIKKETISEDIIFEETVEEGEVKAGGRVYRVKIIKL